MAEDNSQLTPEKRLLQLIEGGGEGGGPATAAKKGDILEKVKSAMSPEGFKNLALDIKDNLTSTFKNRKDFLNLKGANRLMKVATVALAIYLLMSVFYEIKVVNSNYVSNLQIPQREMAEIDFSKAKIFDSNIANQGENVNVFIPSSKRRNEETEEKEDAASLQLVNLIKDWKLAGISIYPQNPARTFCMIEDLQKSTTTFLKVGDSLSGLKVDQINSDSVVFRLNKETVELR